MARILLVEDNVRNQDIFVTVLRHHGHDVSLVEDGQSAIDFVEQSIPDLMLLDLSLPIVDGWTVARRIRANRKPEIRNLYILALTAHSMRGDRERALEAGCNDYLSKPISPRELARRVSEIVESATAA